MLCKIKNCHKIGFGIFLSVFAVALSVLFSLDTNALSLSQTYTQNSSVTRNQAVFPDCNDYNCLSQYSYLQVENNNRLSISLFIKDSTGSRSFSVPSYFPITIFKFDSFSSVESYLHFNSNDTFSYGSVTFTLLDSLGSPPPSGNLDISQNGQYDVSSYATVNVNVPAEVIPGDYHDDLVKINNSILVCGAICLVLYFFYCIYRLIIRNSGSS